MRSKSTIRQVFAGFLLFIFAFAITPKRYLHSIVANHRDTYVKLTDGKTELCKAGIYCQCDNLVATSPFTDTGEKPEIKIPLSFVLHEQKFTFSHITSRHYFFELRGPPALNLAGFGFNSITQS